MPNKIAVTGTGRSGTNFFAALLTELGKDVKHEAMGSDGIASWCLVANVEDAVYGPGGAILNDDFVVGHQVRHPLKAIGSLTTFNKSSWNTSEQTHLHCHEKSCTGQWCIGLIGMAELSIWRHTPGS